jgi:hypothetical protein
MAHSPEGAHENYHLPVVKPELLAPMDQELREKGRKEFMAEARGNLKHNNPELYEYMKKFSGKFRSPTDRILILGATYLAHELLRRQAEADALDSQFE